MTFGLKRQLAPVAAQIRLPGDSKLTFVVSVPDGAVSTLTIRYSIDPAIGVMFSDARCPLPGAQVAFPRGRPGLEVLLSKVQASADTSIPLRCTFALRPGSPAPESFEVVCVATDADSQVSSSCDIVVIP